MHTIHVTGLLEGFAYLQDGAFSSGELSVAGGIPFIYSSVHVFFVFFGRTPPPALEVLLSAPPTSLSAIKCTSLRWKVTAKEKNKEEKTSQILELESLNCMYFYTVTTK